MMNEQVKKFIEQNIDLIDQNRWEEIYQKDFPAGFTETLLDCDLNPLKQGLDYIPKRFLRYSDIKEFIIPNNVTGIGEHAFSYCDNLTSIKIPDSVTSIGEYAFRYCGSLTSIKIPDSITSIGDYTLSGCESLTNIKIPDSIISIGSYAFGFCHSLTSIEIPNSVASMGVAVFAGCNSLTSVTIPDSVANIGEWAFADCSSLTSVKYLGSKKQAMQLGIGNRSRKKWRQKSKISKIICSDGEIEL